MTRARRPVVHNVPYLITCDVMAATVVPVHILGQAVLDALGSVGHRFGAELHAYVVMPDHWHALISTSAPHDISAVMGWAKTRATFSVHGLSDSRGVVWQPRFHDHLCRDEEETRGALGYIHWNPVVAELVESPQQWPWSSWFAYAEGGEPPVPVEPLPGAFDAHWADWDWQPRPKRKRPRRHGP